MSNAVSVEIIATKIFEVRNKKVILDSDLAKLYGVGIKDFDQSINYSLLNIS